MIFITGTTGSIGGYVYRSLIEAGHQIQALRRCGGQYDVSKLIECKSENPLIIHLGSATPANTSDKQRFAYLENVKSIKLIVKKCAERGIVPKLIYASSMSVYESPRWDQRIFETSPLTTRNTYGKSKIACERLIESAFKSSVIHSYICLRLPGVLAPGSAQASKNFLSRVIHDAYHGKKINASNPDFVFSNCLSVIDLYDFIEKLVALECLPCCQANVSCSDGATLSTVIEYILELLESRSVVTWTESRTKPFEIDTSTAASLGFKAMTVHSAIKSHIENRWFL